jgi:hypothetical protein
MSTHAAIGMACLSGFIVGAAAIILIEYAVLLTGI